MNGRVYLPELGVFLSPDPFIQFPESTQNYNRYTYVGNNPLSATDPSGHFISLIVAAVMSAGSYSAGQWATAMFVSGFLESGGNVKHAILTGISGGIGAQLGAAYQASKLTFGAALFAHAATQGLVSVAGGGRFGDGALAAGVGFFAANALPGASSGPKRVIRSAVVGGTVSKLTGGKFANGAASAAFSAILSTGIQAAKAIQANPLDREMAQLARNVTGGSYEGVGDWVLEDRIELESGLRAGLYVNGAQRALVFAGTDFALSDWATNIGQAFGAETAQYTQAMSMGQDLVMTHGRGNVHFAGFSLGGGLAAAAAIRTGGSATIFNPAGVHSNTISGYDPRAATIRSYHSSFDMLRVGNALTPAQVYGQRYSLGAAGLHSSRGYCEAAC